MLAPITSYELPVTQEGQTEFEFTRTDFDYICEAVHAHSGIVLGGNKFNMVYARLARRLRALGLGRFGDYCDLLKSPQGRDEIEAFTNAMTTNLTRFFREPHHFEHFVAEILSKPSSKNRLRLWSAGCSTGEEPYSLAMTLMEHRPLWAQMDVKILATDLDTKVLKKAAAGLYETETLRNLSPERKKRYFSENNDRWQVSDGLRKPIIFKPLNLLHAWPVSGPFDAIFCRNVMIYFDNVTKAELVRRFAQVLRPGGYLYIGHSEALLNQQGVFRFCGKTIYQRLAPES
jgi:chemotaxis protein methyltransferase CheR